MADLSRSQTYWGGGLRQKLKMWGRSGFLFQLAALKTDHYKIINLFIIIKWILSSLPSEERLEDISFVMQYAPK